MKYILRLTLFIAASIFMLSFTAGAAMVSSSINGKHETRDDDHDGRIKWEFMRLRDPKTNRIPFNIRNLELKYAKTLPTVEQVEMQKGIRKPQSLTWNSIGPYNVGGRTRALAVDVTNNNVILAGGVSGGMWRSTDGGQSWNKTTSPNQLQSVSCIAQDTRAGHTNVFYYGTGEAVGNSTSGGSAFYLGDGIFKSTDGGQSWFPLSATQHNLPQSFSYSFQIVWDVAIDPSNTTQDVVYAATYGAIEKSTDGGNTWQPVLGNGSGEFTNVIVTNTGVVYATLSSGAGSNAGIWRSTSGNSGTFVNITPSGFPSVYRSIVMDAAPSDQSQIYFLAETPGAGKVLVEDDGSTDGHSLWKYTDGAQSPWEDRSANLPAFGGMNGNFNSQGSYDILIKVKPDNPNFVVIGGTNLYRSTDGFATPIDTSDWFGGYNLTSNNSQYPNQHPDQHAFVFLPSNPNIVISGNDGGISESSDVTATKVSWTKLDNGYITSQFYSVAVDQAAQNDNVVIGGLQDNGDWFYNSTNPNANWVDIPFAGDGTMTAIANYKAYYYVGSQNGFVIRTTLNAQGNYSNWSVIKPIGASGFLFVTPYVLDPNNSNIMYFAAGDSVWRNSNLSGIPNYVQDSTSVNWSVMNNTAKGDVVTALAVSKNPANILYYGTENGGVYKVDNANTGDPIPTDIWSGKGLSDGAYVSCIAVDPDNGNNVMLVYSNYNVISLYYSSDGGNSWTDVAGNLEQNADGSGDGPSCRWASILNYQGTTYYFVSTSTGVYSTTQLNGTSTVWAQESANSIGNVVCDMVTTRETDGKVVVGTHGNGVYYTYVGSAAASDTTSTLLSYDNNNPQTGVYETMPNKDWVLANRLTAPQGNFKIDKLIYYIGGDESTGNASFYPVVYPGSIANFGTPDVTPFYAGQLFTPQKGWNTIDISSSSVNNPTTSGSDFWVGAKYDGTNEPLIGIDTVTNGRGWEYNPNNSTWTQLDNENPPFHATLYIRAEITTLTGTEEINTSVPKYFSLMQNYPNPFNPSTIIEYNLPKAENVKVIVYDILGREVASLVDAYQNAGEYKIQWNGRNDFGSTVASGIYLYSFEAGSFKSVKKMIFLK